MNIIKDLWDKNIILSGTELLKHRSELSDDTLDKIECHIIDAIIESRIEKLRDITVKKVSQLTFDKQVEYHNNLKQKSNRNEIEEFELEVLNSLF